MLKKSLQKLIDWGLIKLLKSLSQSQRNKIENSATKNTIPADVAIKEESISTPARWVFDAISKTMSGYSLNNILAKGTLDMIKMVNMVLC